MLTLEIVVMLFDLVLDDDIAAILWDGQGAKSLDDDHSNVDAWQYSDLYRKQ